jgi:phenylalanyl-tRNA synthetase beta chain
MIISRQWLQKFFDTPLPSVRAQDDAFTFHAFEVEESSDVNVDLKVLPDRANYALSHRGIAYELGAILNIPLTHDPLAKENPLEAISIGAGSTDALTLSIETKKCDTFVATVIKGVTVSPSPQWLKEALESVGQRSINNVVDATNYVMLHVGQPLHAFDADKLANEKGEYELRVREASAGEKITTLSKEEVTLPEGALVVCTKSELLGIAGIKGGAHAEVNTSTKNLVLEAAHFDGTSVRKTAQAIKLFTDASTRFQNNLSPRLAQYGMSAVVELILEIAGGTCTALAMYSDTQEPSPEVSLTLAKVSSVLGREVSTTDIEEVFKKLQFSFVKEGEVYKVTPPFFRKDICIAEDIIEEVGRILGYESIVGVVPNLSLHAIDHVRYNALEQIKSVLAQEGFNEISSQAFAKKGDILLANPLQSDKPYLRSTLTSNMTDALEKAVYEAPRVLGVVDAVRLFELGNVFANTGESTELCLGARNLLSKKPYDFSRITQQLNDVCGISLDITKVENGVIAYTLLDEQLSKQASAPQRISMVPYTPISIYPFALRDVAVWTPEGTQASDVEDIVRSNAGEYLVRIDLFDSFTKEGRTSYAFRLVFESKERTLSDTDLQGALDAVYGALTAQEGFQIR